MAPAAPATTDPFADWRPHETLPHLARREVRWGLLIPTALLLGAMTASAVWIYQRPQLEAREARTGLETAAIALQPGLASFSDLNETLTEPTIDATLVNQVMLDLDDGVRRFFDAGAELNATDGSGRSRVLKVAGDLSDAQRLFTGVYTYRAALIPLLASPVFETDPGLITLEAAAEAFSDWEAGFESTRTSLPEGVLLPVTAALEALAGELEDIRGEYLGSLGESDMPGAGEAIDRLGAELSRIEGLLFEGLGEAQDRIETVIRDTMGTLRNLPSLFG